MRPRRFRRVVAASASGIVFAGCAVGFGVREATADTVSLSGVFGVRPAYPAALCQPCRELRHPSLPWSVPATERVIARWAATPDTAAPGTPKVALTYSQSSVAALDHLKKNPGSVRVWAFGSPETPGNGKRDRKYTDETLPAEVDWVVRQYDSVADRPQDRTNWLANINASLGVHTGGYNDIDLDNPDAVWEAPNGNTVRYYRTDVLPILKPIDWLVSDERMAELDAKYRPLIEKAYDRPVDLEKTWSAEQDSVSAERATRRERSGTRLSASTSRGGSTGESGSATPAETRSPSKSESDETSSGGETRTKTTKSSSDGGDTNE